VVAECANPDCRKPFLYLHEGRLLRLICADSIHDEPERYELFWLCSECAEQFTIVRISAERTAVIPHPPKAASDADEVLADVTHASSPESVVLQCLVDRAGDKGRLLTAGALFRLSIVD